jgi:O-phosphoseryl-tRNA synthetase
MKKAPCRVKAYRRDLRNKTLEVYLIETEEGKSLCGPAITNELYVYDGGVYALPPSGFDKGVAKEAKEKGVKVGISFISAFADLIAWHVEKIVGDYEIVQVKNVRSAADINIVVPSIVDRFVTAHNKTLQIKGPVFVTAEIKLV